MDNRNSGTDHSLASTLEVPRKDGRASKRYERSRNRPLYLVAVLIGIYAFPSAVIADPVVTAIELVQKHSGLILSGLGTGLSLAVLYGGRVIYILKKSFDESKKYRELKEKEEKELKTEAEKELDGVRKKTDEFEKRFEELQEKTTKELETQLRLAGRREEELSKRVDALQKLLDQQNETIEGLRKSLVASDKRLADYDRKNEQLRACSEENGRLSEKLVARDERITRILSDNGTKTSLIEHLERKVETLTKDLNEKDSELARKETVILAYQEKFKKYELVEHALDDKVMKTVKESTNDH